MFSRAVAGISEKMVLSVELTADGPVLRGSLNSGLLDQMMDGHDLSFRH